MEQENIIISPKSFTSKGNSYSLIAGGSTLQVKINGQDVSKYLTMGTSVGWYDVSKNSGRDVQTASGKMILNVTATKYRLDLATPYLENDDFIDFFREIIKKPTMTVEFLNPFTGNWKTINAYRGDRSASPYMPNIFSGTTIALIEL